MAIYAGIDCGTQGTKVLLINTAQQRTLGEGSASHDLISNANGCREQHPIWWIEALTCAFQQAVQNAGIRADQIRGIAVSGQQHGMVALDAQGEVLYPAKLWCDTETAAENAWFLQQLGGSQGSLEKLGLLVSTGFTASKVIWLKRHHPELWQRLATILLPHDYLNYWLTGRLAAEYGDASGTGLFDVRQRKWHQQAVNLIDNSGRLWSALPPLIQSHQAIGTVCPIAIQALGLAPDTLVASGGGDNMMSAIGTGNVEPGVMTMSLGTSGTLFAYAQQPIESTDIAGFCSSTDGWLPLICTMNVTATTSMVQKLLGQDLTTFNQALQQTEPGAGGMIMLPFFNGERVPDLPTAKASLHHLDSSNFTPANLSRAAVEAATFGLRYGLDLFIEQGLKPEQIRLTGGGARSAIWRQIVADVMQCPVICPGQGEAAALGAAIKAAWCVEAQQSGSSAGNQQRLHELCQQLVTLDPLTRTLPERSAAEHYQQIYQRYLEVLRREYPVTGGERQ